MEIDNVELSFSNKLLLNGIYLKAETGKITGILGGNGCGKTSLLNILFGSLESKTKLIRIDNKPYLKPLFQSGIIKYLPQHPYIPGHLKIKTVFDIYGISWEEFIEDFENFKAYSKFTVKELSGGERRVIEAILIIRSKAEIVLFDEPFTHLAPIYVEKFTEILKKEVRNKAIIITDHMFHHVIDLADDLYFLKNGHIQLIKDPLELEDFKYLNPGTLGNF